MWAHNTLLYMALMWWVQYRSSVLLFPDDITVGYDMKAHFYTNRRPYLFSIRSIRPRVR